MRVLYKAALAKGGLQFAGEQAVRLPRQGLQVNLSKVDFGAFGL